MEAPAPPSSPPAWPRSAQAATAGLLAASLTLMGWHVWTLQRGATRPIEFVAGPGADRDKANPPQRKQRPQAPPAPKKTLGRGGKKTPPTEPLDVNAASLTQLRQLPRIGPQMAQRIVEARDERPFQSVDDLRRVRGIGPKTLEKLRPFVRVGSPVSPQLADSRPARP